MQHDGRLDRLLALLHSVPARLVYISTSGVYGDRNGMFTDELVPAEPLTDRGERRLAAERLLAKWCDRRHCELTVLRVPAIYGPGRLGIERIQSGEAIVAEHDAHPGNRIHVDDLASCCIAAMHRDVPGGIYNVGDGDFRSASWFAKTVAQLAGIPAPPEVSRRQAQETFTPGRLSFLNESRRLDNTKMRQELGVQPRDPETGIRDSLS
jgi:nucleoside-diphosphate-sugar epimerase